MTTPSHSVTIRASIPSQVGMLGQVMSHVAETGALVGGVEIVATTPLAVTRDIAVLVRDEAHADAVIRSISSVEGVQVEQVSDRVLLRHVDGKIGMRNRAALVTRDDLAMAYTPGVARVCMAIHHDPEQAWTYTVKGNSVMMVSDGSSVLGEGDLGPLAALPALEARSLFLRERAGVDGFPLPLAERDLERMADALALAASPFAGVHLSDVAAPRAHELEAILDDRLDIPVLADERATAAAVLAALTNALVLTGTDLGAAAIVVAGAGPAGVATARILSAAGAGDVVLCDEQGAVHSGRSDLDDALAEVAELTNATGATGPVADLIAGAHALVAFEPQPTLGEAEIEAMAVDRIVFSLTTPPSPAAAPMTAAARILATMRPDAPNYLSSALAFPGIWRAALDARVGTISDEMVLAAARAIAAAAADEGLSVERVLPSLLSPHLVASVAVATHAAAREAGLARPTIGEARA